MLHALPIDSRKDRRRLLKSIKPVRKQAGKVRDMDVLVEFASRPRPAAEQDCSIRLLESLGDQRAKHARKLQSVIQKQMPVLRKRLKRCSRLLDKTLQDAKGKRHVTKWSTEAAALALRLEAELRSWRALNRSNLHEFRLKVKELRCVLRMAAESDNRFVETLAEVKDTVGEWHDWQTLAGTSKEVINHPGCEFIKQIRSIADRKFEIGLAAARRMKRQEWRKQEAPTGITLGQIYATRFCVVVGIGAGSLGLERICPMHVGSHTHPQEDELHTQVKSAKNRLQRMSAPNTSNA
jgi:CHAD domain-containing protein